MAWCVPWIPQMQNSAKSNFTFAKQHLLVSCRNECVSVFWSVCERPFFPACHIFSLYYFACMFRVYPFPLRASIQDKFMRASPLFQKLGECLCKTNARDRGEWKMKNGINVLHLLVHFKWYFRPFENRLLRNIHNKLNRNGIMIVFTRWVYGARKKGMKERKKTHTTARKMGQTA